MTIKLKTNTVRLVAAYQRQSTTEIGKNPALDLAENVINHNHAWCHYYNDLFRSGWCKQAVSNLFWVADLR